MTAEAAPLPDTRRYASALQVQGVLFAAMAVIVGSSFAIARFMGLPEVTSAFNAGAGIQLCALLIFVFGAPHGALDVVFARRSLRLRTVSGWVLFLAGYLLLAASVVAIWKAAPSVFLIGFLLMSAFHFSGDPWPRTPALVRVLYGGAILVLPVTLHGSEVYRLFDLLTGSDAARLVIGFIQGLAWPWMLGCLVACFALYRLNCPGAAELLGVTLLGVFAPPLLSFTLFFCFMHSARHILRARNWLRDEGRPIKTSSLAQAAVAPMAGLAGLLIFGMNRLETLPLDQSVIQLVFVSLAALTVPHMILIEPVRFECWHHSGPS